MPGATRFQPHRSPDEGARLRHIENYLTEIGAVVASAAVTAGAARNTGTAGVAGASGSSGGGSGALAGDVTGPAANTLVALLQGVTLTLTSPVTGQVLTFNGTAIVNSDTVTGNLTITGVTATGGLRTAVAAKTANYTLVYTDKAVLADASGGPFTLTLPTAVGRSGQEFEVKKVDATVNPITVATTGGETIDGGATAVILMPQTALGLRSTGSNWDIF